MKHKVLSREENRKMLAAIWRDFPNKIEDDDGILRPIISRRDAEKYSAVYFFTGIPCEHGHISLRKVDNDTCLACNINKHRKS